AAGCREVDLAPAPAPAPAGSGPGSGSGSGSGSGPGVLAASRGVLRRHGDATPPLGPCAREPPSRWRSTRSTLPDSWLLRPGRRSALRTRLTRGDTADTVSVAARMTGMTSSHSPSMVVNIDVVSWGSPESRTTRTASATAALIDADSSSVVVGATE